MVTILSLLYRLNSHLRSLEAGTDLEDLRPTQLITQMSDIVATQGFKKWGASRPLKIVCPKLR